MARKRGTAVEPTVWRRLKEWLSLPGMEAWSTTMRTLFLNALFLAAVIIILLSAEWFIRKRSGLA